MAKQHRQGVLGECDLLFYWRDGRSRLLVFDFHLRQFQFGYDPALELQFEQAQGFGARVQCFLRDFELAIELSQQDIGIGDG